MSAIATRPASLIADLFQRACAKLAHIAVFDTVHGGNRAERIAQRLDRMGSSIPGHEIVGAIYCEGATAELDEDDDLDDDDDAEFFDDDDEDDDEDDDAFDDEDDCDCASCNRLDYDDDDDF